MVLNRPQRRNSLSEAMLAALQEQLDLAAGNRAVRVIVIAGNGPAFSAGHDLKEVTARREDADRGRAYFSELMATCSRVMVIGLALALSAFVISTDIFLWMLPILAGLVFSVPLAIGSSRHLGMRTRALLFPDQVAEFDQSGKRLIARHRAALAERETDANEANQAAQSGLFRVLTDPSARNAHETFMT